jgi:hypothetical protein
MTWFLNKSPTLFERLSEEKKRLEIHLGQVGPSMVRDKLPGKLRQLDTAAHVNEWLSSPGVTPTGMRAP